jgi:hypothetical protein
MLIKVDKPRKQIPSYTLVKHTYDCVFTERKGKTSARMQAHARVHACPHRSSTTSQGCASVHYMGECVCCYYFANPSTLSVRPSAHVRPCVFPLEYEFVLKGGNTIAHPHKHIHHGTHVICVIFWKVSGGTDVIPLYERSSAPACVGQEPVRTSGAPA